MSLDRQDLAYTTQQQQAGRNVDSWCITIDPTHCTLGDVYEVPGLAPCDHLWLPAFYDPFYGLNPLQTVSANSIGQIPTLNLNFGLPPGANVPDIMMNPNPVAGGASVASTAAIYSLRFNSVNNAWQIWSLGGLLGWQQLSFENGLTGKSTAMRSISGPISRIWWRLLVPTINYDGTTDLNASTTTYGYSQIRLMASLGFSQTSQEQNALSTETYGSGQGQYDTPPWRVATLGGGGYVSPQLNTAQRLALLKGGTLKESL